MICSFDDSQNRHVYVWTDIVIYTVIYFMIEID